MGAAHDDAALFAWATDVLGGAVRAPKRYRRSGLATGTSCGSACQARRSSAIVKRVRPPSVIRHPRAGPGRPRTSASCARAVERAFYLHREPIDAHRTARCFAAEASHDGFRLLLEDLDAAGFAARRRQPSEHEMAACLRWLASFHAHHLGAPRGALAGRHLLAPRHQARRARRDGRRRAARRRRAAGRDPAGVPVSHPRPRRRQGRELLLRFRQRRGRRLPIRRRRLRRAGRRVSAQQLPRRRRVRAARRPTPRHLLRRAARTRRRRRRRTGARARVARPVSRGVGGLSPLPRGLGAGSLEDPPLHPPDARALANSDPAARSAR